MTLTDLRDRLAERLASEPYEAIAMVAEYRISARGETILDPHVLVLLLEHKPQVLCAVRSVAGVARACWATADQRMVRCWADES